MSLEIFLLLGFGNYSPTAMELCRSAKFCKVMPFCESVIQNLGLGLYFWSMTGARITNYNYMIIIC